MIAKATFAIANTGTASGGVHMPGYTLVALHIPTIDSSTIEFSFAEDDAGTYLPVKTNTHAAAPADINLGTADTGAKVVAVPEEVGRLAGVGFLRLDVAAQSPAVNITGFFMKR